MALTIDGSDPTGDLGDLLDAKLPIAGGKVLQIVRATDGGTNRSTTSTSFVDVTGMSVTITPQKSDSAIIVIAAYGAIPPDSTQGLTRITDSSNNSLSGAEEINLGGTGTVRAGQVIFGYSTPATTSATTYKLRFKTNNGANSFTIHNSAATGQMYAIEVSA